MKKILYRLGRYSGLPFLFRELIQPNKVTFLLFHDLNQELAERSLLYLRKKYNIISLSDYVDAVLNKKRLPKKAMVITFDDGYIGNYQMLPVVKKLGVPISIFVCASLVGTKKKFWFDFENLPLSIAELNQKSNCEKLKLLNASGFKRDMKFEEASVLGKKQIAEMKVDIDFQAHGKYHPILPKCTNEEAWDEINSAKQILENEFDLRIRAFAYPNGVYSNRDIAMVKKAGYSCAITVDNGFNDKNTDLFRLKRFVIRDDHDMDQLIVKASGAWAFVKTLIGYQPKNGLIEAIDS